MIGLKHIVSFGVVFLVAMITLTEARAQCAGTTACIVIQFPDRPTQAISTHPDRLRVRKDVRDEIGTITFIVAGARVDGKVKFEPRTPLVFANGEPRPEIRLSHGVPASFPIAEFLKGCDNECALGDEDCIADHCRYKYSVVDSEGEYEELDPDVVIDPR